jgi:hypothetical protein
MVKAIKMELWVLSEQAGGAYPEMAGRENKGVPRSAA